MRGLGLILGITFIFTAGYFGSSCYKHKVEVDANVIIEKERTEQLRIIRDVSLNGSSKSYI
ncbi:MAG: hypothetical protein CTY38_01080 [Methylotenera sp.]|nr:MAG: hypothetical protein CTY38_01080 [Methylotenera sp.]